MTCHHPISAYQSLFLKSNGLTKIKFTLSKSDRHLYKSIKLSCNQCSGCRLRRATDWAIRCVHEASLYGDENCFITLTFDDKHLPENLSLDHRDFQLFMKRLRRKCARGFYVDVGESSVFFQRKKGIRDYHAGEYGSLLGRPHHHAIIFNFDFPDKVFFRIHQGNKLYRSKILEELWPYGYSTIAEVNFNTAAYVARYCMKKVTGKVAKEHYKRFLINDDGEVLKEFTLKPEYNTMSRRKGIGQGWFEKYHADIFPSDEVVVQTNNGIRKFRVPKFYDTQFEILSPGQFLTIKKSREDFAKSPSVVSNNTPERLSVRERVLLSKINRLRRVVE